MNNWTKPVTKMNEEQKKELGDLRNLRAQSGLDETQATKYVELVELESTEKTVAAEKSKKDFETVAAQKEHFRTKFEKEEADRKAIEAKLAEAGKTDLGKSLDVGDYIDISASLEGLDQREKEFLAKQHKTTGRPLKEIRNDEDFNLWQTAYRSKMEKEKSLRPSGTQPDTDRPKTLAERLAAATIAEKEKILTEAGLYKSPRPRTDRVNIGPK